MKGTMTVRKAWVTIVGAVIVMVAVLSASMGRAQTFSSGSTGADGAFAPSANTTLTVPASGIFNFTTITIPAGVTVTFTPNAANTSVTMLATGDVSIAGAISLDAEAGQGATLGGFAGKGGPGGFRGGNGHGIQNVPGGSGIGPGGGAGSVSGGGGGSYGTAGSSNTGTAGPIYGSPELLPLIGGSGGGGSGGGTAAGQLGGGGGGGGGAVVVASSGTITIQSGGLITASGGLGGVGSGTSTAGSGSGGAIRLVAGVINIAGTGGTALRATTGLSGPTGRVRLEVFTILRAGAATLPTASTGLPTLVRLFNPPTVSIVSVGGVGVPSVPTGAGGGLDVSLPNQTGPTTIELAASGIPLGTTINVSIKPETGSPVNATSTGLSGTETSSTATATATLPTGSSIISATVTLSAGGSASLESPFMIGGEPVKNIRLASVFGGKASIFLITEAGKEIQLE